MIMKRLKEMKHPFPDRHLSYPGVGHFIPFPNSPATVNVVINPITNVNLFLGGDPEHTAVAARDSWAQIIHFLNASLSNKALRSN